MAEARSPQVAQESASGSGKAPSCIPLFDALWFCYSPVYQMREYYVEGQLDDCRQHWSKFLDCMRQKTRYKDEEVETIQEHPLWQIRTPEEAAQKWQQEFGSSGHGQHEEEPVLA